MSSDTPGHDHVSPTYLTDEEIAFRDTVAKARGSYESLKAADATGFAARAKKQHLENLLRDAARARCENDAALLSFFKQEARQRPERFIPVCTNIAPGPVKSMTPSQQLSLHAWRVQHEEPKREAHATTTGKVAMTAVEREAFAKMSPEKKLAEANRRGGR